jgi:hypothetical protein
MLIKAEVFASKYKLHMSKKEYDALIVKPIDKPAEVIDTDESRFYNEHRHLCKKYVQANTDDDIEYTDDEMVIVTKNLKLLQKYMRLMKSGTSNMT